MLLHILEGVVEIFIGQSLDTLRPHFWLLLHVMHFDAQASRCPSRLFQHLRNAEIRNHDVLNHGE